MRIYKDREKKEEITDRLLHFGKVLAGESKLLTIYLYNETEGILEDLTYKFPTSTKEYIEIVSAPKIVRPKEIEELVVKWTPSLDFKSALDTGISIEGMNVYYSKNRSKDKR